MAILHTCVSEEVDNICSIKCALRRLRDDVESDVPFNVKAGHLSYIMETIRHQNRDL